ncbi:MAG: sigma 54-interacting transcriptional regulator [Polyangiaceae bacterium]|nr:sigma 54-interacting transcriptional regulator [Polyangiaceae bacterium]
MRERTVTETGTARPTRPPAPPRAPGVVIIFQREACAPVPHRIDRPRRFGRSEDADVSVGDGGVSRLHALIEPAPGGVYVTDLGSRNGTFVNREPVVTPRVLAPVGAIVRFGSTIARVMSDVARYELAVENPYPALIGGPSLAGVRAGIALAAVSTAPALIEGETGTGKEVIARAIHDASGRSGRYVTVNCAALAPELVESELFGHVRGSFSGASGSRPGLFRSAHKGTLLLDEVGELPLPIQAKLLRVVEAGEVRGIGEDEPAMVDVRIVAATNRDLDVMVGSGTFRRDLLHRIAATRIRPPPLRERLEDLPLLFGHFLVGENMAVSVGAMEVLLAQSWAGNVRELRNVALAGAAAAKRANRDEVLEEDVQVVLPAVMPSEPDSLKARIVTALSNCEGNVKRAAQEVGMARSGFYEHLKRLNLDPSTFRKRG